VATKTVALAMKMVTGVMIVDGAMIISPLAMLTLLAKFVISMGIRQRIVGGAMEMIIVTIESVETMMLMLIWHHMELIPIGIMILGPLIILLES
jgi:KaiC/GvpD/RAD55 family RecA-like ATPase